MKTDRRDALRLARSHRSGDLTAVWIPDEGSEALRNLVRAREAAKQDQLRARHRLSKFLLRSGQRPAPGVKAWKRIYMASIRQIHFAQMAHDECRLCGTCPRQTRFTSAGLCPRHAVVPEGCGTR